MKKYTIIALLALFSTQLSLAADTADITVTTYNITHAKKNDWNLRKAGNIALIKELNSDILALQEVIDDNDQLKTIQDTLSGYGWVGEKRNSHLNDKSTWRLWFVSSRPIQRIFNATDEYCPIFYNKEKFELLNTQTFGINTGGYDLLPRIATVACLKHKLTHQEFCVCNTHLEHKSDSESEQIRTAQAQIIINKLKDYKDKPILLMGDFNTTFDKDMKKVLTDAGFVHGKKIAEKVSGPAITHEKSSTKKLIECDFILIKPQEKFNVQSYETIDAMSPETSDHNPVKMKFSLNE